MLSFLTLHNISLAITGNIFSYHLIGNNVVWLCFFQLLGNWEAQMRRVMKMIAGGGLSITGSHTMCGDYLYSGHTVMLTLTYLFIKECKFLSFYTVVFKEIMNMQILSQSLTHTSQSSVMLCNKQLLQQPLLSWYSSAHFLLRVCSEVK